MCNQVEPQPSGEALPVVTFTLEFYSGPDTYFTFYDCKELGVVGAGQYVPLDTAQALQRDRDTYKQEADELRADLADCKEITAGFSFRALKQRRREVNQLRAELAAVKPKILQPGDSPAVGTLLVVKHKPDRTWPLGEVCVHINRVDCPIQPGQVALDYGPPQWPTDASKAGGEG